MIAFWLFGIALGAVLIALIVRSVMCDLAEKYDIPPYEAGRFDDDARLGQSPRSGGRRR